VHCKAALPPMSEMGQSRQFDDVCGMSGSPPIASEFLRHTTNQRANG
jgi:hypothetical protein